MSTISVIGAGYLGATHAACLAELGHRVIGIDRDQDKVARLAAGEVPFFEPGLADLIRQHTQAGTLTFDTDISAAAEAHLHFVCVGTPQAAGADHADVTQVHRAVDDLAKIMPADSTVVGKSTVPVGTAARLQRRVHEATAGSGRLLWNPEFLREGFAVADTLSPDRIVVGAHQPADAEVLRTLYAPAVATGVPFLVTDYATAELVKVAANAFLATKISFVNAMADVCAATGADVRRLAEALGHDDRIGPRFLRAGIGFGGGCLPKDIRAFQARAEELGVGRSLAFLREVDELNLRRRTAVVDTAVALLDDAPRGRRVAVLGAAFKPDSDDVRDSPALEIAAALHVRGAEVVVHDPKALANAERYYPTLGYAAELTTAVRGADVVLLLTEWQEYRDLDPAQTGALVAQRLIIDGRNALSPAAWRDAGWQYRGIGIP